MVAVTAAEATKPKARTKKTTEGSAAPKAKRTMTEDHKESIKAGRIEAAAVRKYLDAVDAHKPKRGRKVTPETLRERLVTVEADLEKATPFEKLLLMQDKADIETRIAELEGAPEADLSDLEAEFVKVAKPFSERKGIDRATFRALGVKPEVLKRAGL